MQQSLTDTEIDEMERNLLTYFLKHPALLTENTIPQE
jgi:hypothetical protein